MDTHGADRIKEFTQKRRGQAGRKGVITEKEQSMPQGQNWTTFLCSG